MHPLAQGLPRVVADILSAAPLSPGKVAFAWENAVGPAIARATAIRLEDGVLLVDAKSSTWARELKRTSPMILGRLQKFLGVETVRQIKVRKL